MVEQQTNKQLRKRFSGIGWMLVVYFLMMNIFVIFCMMVDMVFQATRSIIQGDPNFIPDIDAMINNGWGYILAVALGFVILLIWKGMAYWKQEVFAKEKPMTGMDFVWLLGLCIAPQLINSLWIMLLEFIMNQFDRSLEPMLEMVSGQSGSFSMFLYASILAPISEELLFRGYILRTLRPYGKRFAIVCSAILFGIFHGNLLQTPYAFLVGLVLGYVALEYSVVWSIVLHMFNNLVLADLLGRLTANLSENAIAIINYGIFIIFTVIAGIALVIKRSEIREYNRSEAISGRFLRHFFINAGVIVLAVLMLGNTVLTLLL